MNDAETGKVCGLGHCSSCGIAKIDLDRLRRWKVHVAALLDVVMRTSEVVGPRRELIPGTLWRLGKATWGHHRREAYFFRAVQKGDVTEGLKELASRPKAVVFVATEHDLPSQREHWPKYMLSLEATFHPSAVGLGFDGRYLEAKLAEGAGGKSRGSLPQGGRKGSRLEKIAKLRKALTKHLLEARDHAFSTKNIRGEPDLLPAPTLKRLAKEIGVNPATVTRCFRCDEGAEIRRMLEIAGDLSLLMEWGRQGRA